MRVSEKLYVDEPRGSRRPQAAADKQRSLQALGNALHIIFAIERRGSRQPGRKAQPFDLADAHRERLHESSAKVFLVPGPRIVRERNHGHEIAIAERMRGRALHARNADGPEQRRVPAFGKIDNDGVGEPVLAIVSRRLGPQTPCLHAQDRVRCADRTFLRQFIVLQTLADRGDQLKEFVVGGGE